MVVYSWNMLFRNKRLDEAFAFVRDSGADIFCLQEVPEEFLTRLKTLPYHLSFAPEVDNIFAGARKTQYIATLSRFPIDHEGRIPLPYHEPDLPLRSRIFVSAMVRLRLWALGVGNRHAIYTDVQTPLGALRIINIHLPLATPAWREEELELAFLAKGQGIPTIVCGDFNILEKPHITPLSWFLGGTMGDALFFRRERRKVEAQFAAHNLTNALFGHSTHPLSRSQLDHILISDALQAGHAIAIPQRPGSDHHPILARIALR